MRLCEKKKLQAGFSASNLYYLGAAQKDAGKKNDAIVTLKAAVQANPKNRFDGKVRNTHVILHRLN